jgi:hypothetical protein
MTIATAAGGLAWFKLDGHMLKLANSRPALELSFEEKALRTICESEIEAKSALGSLVAEALKHRLADLRAATGINDLLVGNPRKGSISGVMLLDLAENHQLLFGAGHADPPVTDDGEIDWSRVSRVKLLRIQTT